MVKFLIRQQKFLEALEALETKKALVILRNELAPLNSDSDRLHLLSRRVYLFEIRRTRFQNVLIFSFFHSLIMCGTPEDLRTRSNWDGVAGESRRSLLIDLQRKFKIPSLFEVELLLTFFLDSRFHQANLYATSAKIDNTYRSSQDTATKSMYFSRNRLIDFSSFRL